MTHTHFFQYNIPAHNHYVGKTDGYINVIAEWNTDSVFHDGRPMVSCMPVNMIFRDCLLVINWSLAYNQISKIAEAHFTELAKAERIEKARAILQSENDITGIPTLDRMAAAENY